MKRLIVGITGASAGVYGVRLLQVLTKQADIEIHLTISSSGARALSEELQIEVDLDNFKLESLIGVSSPQVIYHHESDIAARSPAVPSVRKGWSLCRVVWGALRLLLAGCRGPYPTRGGCVYQGESQTCGRPARNALKSHPFGKHAEIVASGGMRVTRDAGVLSLPKKRGRSAQLHRHKNLGSIRNRYRVIQRWKEF